MRPIETKAMKEAKDRRNKTILGLFIVFIMVFSTVGYILGQREPADQENVVEYNNHTFIRTENGWQTEINLGDEKLDFTSFYLPEELENITLENKEGLSISDFSSKALYILADDNDELQAAYALSARLGQFVDRMQLACSEEEADDDFCLENSLPIKSCEDADAETAIIIIEQVDENEENGKTTINNKDGCLVIKGKGSELLKAAEKAAFAVFGIL